MRTAGRNGNVRESLADFFFQIGTGIIGGGCLIKGCADILAGRYIKSQIIYIFMEKTIALQNVPCFYHKSSIPKTDKKG